MALIQPPMLTHGGTHPARAFRMMVRDLACGDGTSWIRPELLFFLG
ncbi:hypothetical protein [Streptomyces longisporus]